MNFNEPNDSLVRILIHGINYAPELTGIGKYTGELAEWLAGQGHDVRVVTAPPYYPEWRVAGGYSASRYSREVRAGVDVWRCPLWVPAKLSGLKRMLHLASFALSSLPIMVRQALWRPDAVLVIEPPLFCAPAAWACARMAGARTWLHIQDFEVDAAFELGILRAPWLRRLATATETFLMRRFDKISTISQRMLEKLIAKGVAADKASLFANWADISAIFPFEHVSPLRSELSIPANRIVALYSGNMGEKQGLDMVLEAAARLATNPGIQFILCGDGAARAALQKTYGQLANVLWLPLQPVERLNDLLNMADLHLLPQRADVADLVMPSKLTGMLASGRPIIATAGATTQLAQVVSQCGLVVEPGDVEGLAQAVLTLAKDKSARIELGAAGRAFAEANLSKSTVLGSFENDLQELVGA